jgi:preprotein translocase subunit SecB
MTEDTQVSGANGEADTQDLPPIMIGAQYIKDLSFENPQGPEVLVAMSDSPQVNIDINTSARSLADDVYEVALFIRGEAKSDDKTVFIVELTYGGIITLNNVPEEDVQPLLLIEAPRHLFPFARSIVADVTRDGGFPPLLINPMDFVSLYNDAQTERAEQPEQAKSEE